MVKPPPPPPRPVKLPPRFRSRRREWAAILGLVLLLIPLAFLATALTYGALFLPLYVTLLALLSLWNAWVVLDLARGAWGARRARRALAQRLALLTLALPSLLLWGLPFEFQGRAKGPLAAAAALALAYTVGQLLLTARRSRRDYFAPVYNLFNLGFLAAFAAAEGGPPPGLGPLPYLFARTVGLFQAVNLSFAAGFAPLFILPSYLPKVKGLRWAPEPGGPGFDALLRRLPRLRPAARRAAWATSKASGAAVLYFALCLLVLLPLAAGGLASFLTADPRGPPYPPAPGLRFAAVAASFTDVVRPPAGWRELVAREAALAREAGLDNLRFDLKTELLRDNASLTALDGAIATVRAAGLDVILSPFGREAWGSRHPTFEELNATIAEDALLLARRYHPAYLFPFFEPNGQGEVNLGHPMPTAAWVGAIAAVARAVKAESPGTAILIEVAGGLQGPELFAALMATPAPIDAVGFDLYPNSLGDLGTVDAYAAVAAARPGRAFWISEFGLDAIQFGEEAQAAFVAQIVARGRAQWNATGFCLWALDDNAGLGADRPLLSGLGVTALDGRRKPAFAAYRDAIGAARATAPQPM